MKYLICLFALVFATAVSAQSDGEDDIDSYSVRFTPDGWASFSSAHAVALPDGVEAYVGLIQKAEEIDEADYYLYLYRVECPTTEDEIRYIPCPEDEYDNIKHNPVILKGPENTTINLAKLEYDYAKSLYEGYYDKPSVGMLVGNEEKEYNSDDLGYLHTYVLGYKEPTKTGFYEVKPGTTIPPNKAFIEIRSTDAQSPRIKTIIDDDPTSIIDNEAFTQCGNEIIYDLNGNIVKHLEAGKIYIKGGKKFLNK